MIKSTVSWALLAALAPAILALPISARGAERDAVPFESNGFGGGEDSASSDSYSSACSRGKSWEPERRDYDASAACQKAYGASAFPLKKGWFGIDVSPKDTDPARIAREKSFGYGVLVIDANRFCAFRGFGPGKYEATVYGSWTVRCDDGGSGAPANKP